MKDAPFGVADVCSPHAGGSGIPVPLWLLLCAPGRLVPRRAAAPPLPLLPWLGGVPRVLGAGLLLDCGDQLRTRLIRGNGALSLVRPGDLPREPHVTSAVGRKRRLRPDPESRALSLIPTVSSSDKCATACLPWAPCTGVRLGVWSPVTCWFGAGRPRVTLPVLRT
jgi:hypothetical protein